MIVWSPSSWALWKQCPTKYRIKKLERWNHPSRKRDNYLMNLAVPGLVVDQLVQLWLYRDQLDDLSWFDDNFEMVWNKVFHETHPKWKTEAACEQSWNEAYDGLQNAVEMLKSLSLEKYDICPQYSFFETMPGQQFALTGATDLLLIWKDSIEAMLIDLKNAHYREKVTKDQLLLYQIGIEQATGLNIIKSGYLIFHRKVNDWKWLTIREHHKEALLSKLADATEQVSRGEFEYKWSYYSCPRYCDARFGCLSFQKLIGKKSQISEDHYCAYI